MTKPFLKSQLFFKITLVGLAFSLMSCMVSPSPKGITISSFDYGNDFHTLYISKTTSLNPLSTPPTMDSCTIDPVLPAGLVLNSNCSISGSPTELADLKDYLVTLVSGSQTFLSTVWIEIRNSTPFVDFSYAQNLYSFAGPGFIAPIQAQFSGGLPDACYTVPILPPTLKIQKNCSVTGFVLQPLVTTTYTVHAVSMDQNVTSTLTLGVVNSQVLTSLEYYFDARVPRYTGVQAAGCSLQNNLWQDLGPAGVNQRISVCKNTTGWLGSGTPEDPHRWRSDGENFKFKTAGAGMMQGDFTYLIWVRSLSDEVTFLRAGTNGGLSNLVIKSTALNLQDTNTNTLSSGLFMLNNYKQVNISPWIFQKNEWHQLAFVNDTALNKIRVYLDGALVKEFSFYSSPSYYILSHDLTSCFGCQWTYALGGTTGISEYAQVKMISRILTEAEILNECQAYSGFLKDADCRTGLRSSVLNDFNMTTDQCIARSFSLVDLKNQALAPAVDVNYSVVNNTDVSVYLDNSCTVPVNAFTYAGTMTSLPLYFKSPTAGTKKISLAPMAASGPAIVPVKDFSINTTNPPATFQVKYEG
ncbi:MAG: hypothetical protein B7Y39_19140, partial [Bdellovibrio sp. 28-41-41]